jgi:Fe-S-cluster-containing dehydrogenase component/DMSO reductase anchor subunit
MNLNKKCFVMDLNRCTGCGACVIACTIENQNKQAVNWRQVYTFNESHHPDLPFFNFSMACNHCAIPACKENCPSLAYSVDPKTGAVIIDQDLCLGCKYCTWACPYDAPKYNESRGVVEKCDFCISRLNEDLAPACVCACPTNALLVGEFDDEEKSQSLAGFPDTELKPAIRFKGLGLQKEKALQTSYPSERSLAALFHTSRKVPPSKISLRSEWSLLVFTSVVYILVSLFTAAMVSGLRVNPYAFLGIGSFALALSSVHVGKKGRLYRAVFNVKGSWLSREILFFLLFLGCSGLYLLLSPDMKILGIVSVIIGFLSLIFIDRIYQVAMHAGSLNFHSAHTFLNGLYVTGFLTGFLPIFGLSGLLKLSLYSQRKVLFLRKGLPVRPVLSFFRIGLGFIIPLVLLMVSTGENPHFFWIILSSIIGGELVDRSEYYGELDIITPEKQILIDLRSMLLNNNPQANGYRNH